MSSDINLPRVKASVILLAAVFSCPGLAAGKYERDKICPDPNDFRECDRLMEQAVVNDLPGVIERDGRTLRIRANNGEVLKRINAEATGKEGEEVWACDYMPDAGYLRLCYRLWETARNEFVNIKTGTFQLIGGYPAYSPSGKRVLMVDAYGGDVYQASIWRFDEKQIEREFEISYPPVQGWETGEWQGEDRIDIILYSSSPSLSYAFVKEKGVWALTEE